MGWKLFAILRLLVTPLIIYNAAKLDEINFLLITDYLLSFVATGVVCLYAFDGKLLSKPLRLLIAISLSISLAQSAFFISQFVYWAGIREFIFTEFAIPMISGVLSVVAAWRYSVGRTVGTVRA
ncbi:hypothetical protein OIU34_30180 [Pararhizobium sp. BT-229]|uniref:hypothetical protein n=1 Tax=Pararhizobium sp. BT-229 TaxID=2986923 RepID=UPI0021F725B9|nr:hypothetical protein [Pararhizobium sp. BT-229]MCV9966143.1 hypothetical protein [Pararhizobium sp. BT-229]